MGEQPFIKFYPSDFLGGTSGLSPAERGVYITLLCLIYEANSPIKRDDSRLARCCGAPKAAFIRILNGLVAQGKITQEGDALSNKRAEKAIVDRTNRTQNATHAAKQRWDAQPEKTQRNQRQDNATAMPEQCVDDASQNQSQNQSIREEPKGSLSSVDDVKTAFADYNFLAEDIGLPVARVLTKNRRASLKARLSEVGGIDGWRAALDKARASPLCNGENSRGWKADLDFLLQQKSFTRLMEGSYDARQSTANHNGVRPSEGRSHRSDPALEQIARLAGLGGTFRDGGA
jgi:uncharacterized protein YdaU (DUF1376 family)